MPGEPRQSQSTTLRHDVEDIRSGSSSCACASVFDKVIKELRSWYVRYYMRQPCDRVRGPRDEISLAKRAPIQKLSFTTKHVGLIAFP
jgi:hypothetical protein